MTLVIGARYSHVWVLKEEIPRGPTFSSSINQEISEYYYEEGNVGWGWVLRGSDISVTSQRL